MSSKHPNGNDSCGKVDFTIDGRPFSVFDPDQAPGDLIQLAGLDPCGYDLARVRKRQEPKRFTDEAKITVHHGDRFVSVRERATVA